MSDLSLDPTSSTILWLGVKATALLAAAGLLHVVTRRRTSAAARHLLWTVASVGLLLLPIASQVAPQWTLTIPQSGPVEPSTAVTMRALEPARPTTATTTSASLTSTPERRPESGPASGPGPISWWNVALRVYGLGVVGVLLFLMLQHGRTRRLAQRAASVDDAGWRQLLAEGADRIGVRRPVRLLRAREMTVPMTFGTRRPSIVLPAIADTWTDDRRRAVLRHELAHVARYDCLTQTLAVAACAIYWPHPGVWWLARQLRIERELACDDRVLASGAIARDYAGHLLDIAYTLNGGRAPALAVAMARPSQLEGRMLAALDEARNRRTPGPWARLAVAACAAITIVGLAGATPTMETTINQGQSGNPGQSGEHDQSGEALTPNRGEGSWSPTAVTRRLVEAAATLVAEVAQEHRENLPGTWELRPTGTPGTIHLRLVEGRSSNGSNVPIASLEGVTESQLTGPGGPIQFRITRDAGAFLFEGVMRRGVAAGTFSFAPNAAFPGELVKRGFTKPNAREQYEMARHDIGYAFLDELNRLGYAKPDTALLVRAGQHGVDTTYLREMAALGYALGSLPPLITLRDHGVTPDYVRAMAQEGYSRLSADKIREVRDHGVGPEYVKGMREAGYGSVPIDDLVNTRDHGVTPEYVRALAAGGYRGLPLDEVVRVRDHGITPDYIDGMRQLGYTLPIAELVRARNHGVDTDYVRGMHALGYERAPIDRLIKVRDHGVTPEYARELKAIGYDGLSLDDLVQLRDHGITPDRIRSANARAGTKLPIDLLRSMAAGGGLR
jgi:beta-lactamase regulating signal transducer with metallopeptidase domain